MTEAGETDDYSVSDHVRALIKHTHPSIINYCIANISRIPKELYEKYKEEKKFPVKLDENDERWLEQENINLVKAHIASMKEFVRHDANKLSDVITKIINEHKKR
jgi:2-phospho-L-lactate transferase/gluconeogenesis factor (CofD/UPF0052 family)